jgi:TonB family protein
LSIYWQRHFKVSEKGLRKKIEGEGIVSFTIDTTGRVRNIFIKKPLTPEFDAAALKAVQAMPLWEPAEKDGKKIAMGQNLPYFLDPVLAYNRIVPTDLTEAEKIVTQRGPIVGVTLGSVWLTNDLKTYFTPVQFSFGILFGYALNKLELGVGYDIAAISKIRKPFQLEGQTLSTDNRTNIISIYSPISYTFNFNRKLLIKPFIAPVFNSIAVKESGNDNNGYTTIAVKNGFSVSFGICADHLVGKRAVVTKGKQRVESGYIRTRVTVNPMNFPTVVGDTPLKGTAINMMVGFIGAFRLEK